MNLATMITKWEALGKNPNNFRSSQGSFTYWKKGSLARVTHSLVAIQLGKIDSRSKAYT